jgi:hypothetical protein
MLTATKKEFDNNIHLEMTVAMHPHSNQNLLKNVRLFTIVAKPATCTTFEDDYILKPGPRLKTWPMLKPV